MPAVWTPHVRNALNDQGRDAGGCCAPRRSFKAGGEGSAGAALFAPLLCDKVVSFRVCEGAGSAFPRLRPAVTGAVVGLPKDVGRLEFLDKLDPLAILRKNLELVASILSHPLLTGCVLSTRSQHTDAARDV